MNKDTPIFVKAFIQHPCDDGSFDIMIEDTSGRPRFININRGQIQPPTGYARIQQPEEPKDDEGYYVRIKFRGGKDNYKTYKNVIHCTFDTLNDRQISEANYVFINTIRGEWYSWPWDVIEEFKQYPMLKEVEDDEPEKEFGGEYHV